MCIEHQPIVFKCEGEQLLGVIEHPEKPHDIGVLIVTGGPQYRIGSHRQFVLIARALAMHGIPTMRFDYRGMGDSSGPPTSFDQVSDDIKSAINCFTSQSSVKKIVLWGLCDAASACMIYASTDDRVVSLIGLNPWVRSEQGLAKAYVKSYYWRRLVSRAFWTKMASGRLAAGQAVTELFTNLKKSLLPRNFSQKEGRSADTLISIPDFREQMCVGLKEFAGPTLLILCSNDLTAAEFDSFAKQDKDWRSILHRPFVVIRELPDADHTFSKEIWRQEVIRFTIDWVQSRACV